MQPPLTGRLLFYQSEPDRGMIMKLTREEKRIKIAEACGWCGCVDKNCDYRKAQHLHKHGKAWFPEWYSTVRYPDFPCDLNAMHVAWKTLIKDNKQLEDKYSIELLRAVGAEDPSDGTRPNGSDATWALASNASSQARFEALGITLNQWTPDQ